MSDVQGNCPRCGGEMDAYGCAEHDRHQAAEYAAIEAERDRYKAALENIRRHMEFIAGEVHRLSTPWLIANRALEGDAQ